MRNRVTYGRVLDGARPGGCSRRSQAPRFSSTRLCALRPVRRLSAAGPELRGPAGAEICGGLGAVSRPRGSALHCEPGVLRLPIQADAALCPTAAGPRPVDRVPPCGAGASHSGRPELPDRHSGRQRALGDVARGSSGPRVDLQTRRHPAGPRSGLGRDRRSAGRDHGAGGRLAPRVHGWRLLSEQPVSAAGVGPLRRRAGGGRRRHLPGRRVLRQRPSRPGGGAPLRKRPRRGGERKLRALGPRQRRTKRADQLQLRGR